MANNRIYLRCKACGGEFFLGKRQNDGYYVADRYDADDPPLVDRLNAFYEKHKHGIEYEQDCYEIMYETDLDSIMEIARKRSAIRKYIERQE